MSYPGGKGGSGVYQTLINQIPRHDIYCAPFLGRDAILRHKAFAARSIGVDLDAEALEWWHGQAVPSLELYCCDGIEWLRHQFDHYRVGRSTAPSGGDASSPVARSADAAGRDAARCVPASRWFVYIDPPYPMSTRRSGPLYRHEMSDDQHVELLRTIVDLPAAVMVSSYPNELYSEHLAAWRSQTFTAVDRRGNKRCEQLWMNYEQPAELHDYRYLGRDKRQREKFRRRSRNWVAGLLRMKPAERGAILQAIDLKFGTGTGSRDVATTPGERH